MQSEGSGRERPKSTTLARARSVYVSLGWRGFSRRALDLGRHRLRLAWMAAEVVWQRWLVFELGRRTRPVRYTDADPFKLIAVSPGDIRFRQQPIPPADRCVPLEVDDGGRIDRWANLGHVAPGDWDHHVEPWERMPVFEALARRFRDGTPWQEIPFVRRVLREVREGRPAWHGCRTPADVRDRCERMDALFKSMAGSGYLRSERRGFSGRLLTVDLDEITVNIGREGEIIHNNSGAHRLAIAKIVGLPAVPVRVLVRHAGWQARRQAFGPRVPDHPDLRDIVRRASGA